MGSVQTVDMSLMVEKLKLKNLTPDIDLRGMKLASPEIAPLVGDTRFTALQKRIENL